MTSTITLTPTNTITLTITLTSTVTITSTPTPTLTFPTGPVTINYSYDDLNRLTEANYSDGRYYHYAYDQVGNRLTASDQYSTSTYVYDDANRLVSVNDQPYSYDNNGNLLFNGVTTYTYDSANCLISASNTLAVTTYRYSGLGDRLQETFNGQTTTFTVDLAAGLTQTLDDGTNAYLYAAGRIAQMNTTDTQYFLGDALGSVRQLTDATGAVSLAKVYDPYGVVSATSGVSATSYGYTGEYYGDYSELVYLRSRFLSPETGRFLTKDAWQGNYSRPGSLNRWNYVESNSVNYTDWTFDNKR